MIALDETPIVSQVYSDVSNEADQLLITWLAAVGPSPLTHPSVVGGHWSIVRRSVVLPQSPLNVRVDPTICHLDVNTFTSPAFSDIRGSLTLFRY